MQAELFKKLRASISSHRLDSYRQAGQSDFDVIASYLWNMALCEALYPSLQALEVTLRNSIHAAAVRRYNSDFWFDLPGCNLHQSQQNNVDYAKQELQKKVSVRRTAWGVGEELRGREVTRDSFVRGDGRNEAII